MMRAIRTIPGVVDVNSDQQDKGLAASLVIDRPTAARMGISTAAIDNTLYDAFGQRQVSTMYTQLNQYHVVMEAEPAFWQNPDGLQYLYVKGSKGEVPLSAFTHYEAKTSALLVPHSGQFPSVTISFNLVPGKPLGDGGGRDPARSSARWGCPPTSWAVSPARRRRFRIRWPTSRCW